MKASLATCALAIGLAAITGGCAQQSTTLRASEAPPYQRADAKDQRRVLNEGYSILYSHLDGLTKLDLIFLVKSEAPAVKDVTTAVTEYAESFKATMDRVARDYPAVNITLEPLPIMEQRTRSAVTKDRILSVAPVVGLTGESFDRRMLQNLEGLLNQLRFLTEALAEEEPEPSLKQILSTAHSKFDAHYGQVLALLADKYYVNTGQRKVGESTGKSEVP